MNQGVGGILVGSDVALPPAGIRPDGGAPVLGRRRPDAPELNQSLMAPAIEPWPRYKQRSCPEIRRSRITSGPHGRGGLDLAGPRVINEFRFA